MKLASKLPVVRHLPRQSGRGGAPRQGWSFEMGCVVELATTPSSSSSHAGPAVVQSTSKAHYHRSPSYLSRTRSRNPGRCGRVDLESYALKARVAPPSLVAFRSGASAGLARPVGRRSEPPMQVQRHLPVRRVKVGNCGFNVCSSACTRRACALSSSCTWVATSHASLRVQCTLCGVRARCWVSCMSFHRVVGIFWCAWRCLRGTTRSAVWGSVSHPESPPPVLPNRFL